MASNARAPNHHGWINPIAARQTTIRMNVRVLWPATFELSKNKAGQFCFNLLAANKRVILTSEAYATRASLSPVSGPCAGMPALRDRFERRIAKNGKSYFVLLARNGEIIGQSQRYAHRIVLLPVYSIGDGQCR